MSSKIPVRICFSPVFSRRGETRYSIPYKFLSELYDITITSNFPELVVYHPADEKSGDRHLCPSIFWNTEPQHPNFEECDFSISFDPDIPGGNFYYPFYSLSQIHPQVPLDKSPYRIFSSSSASRKFCNFIFSNKSSTREVFFDLLSAYKHIDSPGRRKRNMKLPETLSRKSESEWTKGWRWNKILFQKEYKFSIAFENISYPQKSTKELYGYTSEKIVDALVSNTIPIYWGNPNVGKIFNPKSFINCHDYETFEEIIEVVKEVDQDDNLYRSYLEAPIFIDNIPPDCFDKKRMLSAIDEVITPLIKQRKHWKGRLTHSWNIKYLKKMIRRLTSRFGIQNRWGYSQD